MGPGRADVDDAELAALLAEQQAFLSSGQTPSASVSRARSTARGEEQAAAEPVPASHAGAPLTGGPLPVCGQKDVLPPTKATARGVQAPPPSASTSFKGEDVPYFPSNPAFSSPEVLSQIHERPLRVGKARATPPMGFPLAAHRSLVAAETRCQLSRPADRANITTPDAGGGVPVRERPGGYGELSGPPSMTSLQELIEEENQARLAGMTEQQILSAQKQLERTLNPALVAKLRSLHSGRQTTSSPATAAKQSAVVAADKPRDFQTDLHLSASAQLQQSPSPPAAACESELELCKLEWTLDPQSESAAASMGPATSFHHGAETDGAARHAGSGSSEAALLAATRALGLHDERFDFDGKLVVGEREPTEALHHHGDEPAKAGYTMAELCHLSRSTVPAQRTQALRTLGAVWATQRRSALRSRVARWSADADAAVLVRLALDDPTASAVHAALAAAVALAELRSTLPVEELLLLCAAGSRRWRGYHSPYGSGGATAAAGSETDAERCRRDLLDGWCEMQLCERLRYLLEVGEISPAGRQQVIGLLCLCADHSLGLANRVARCPRLLIVLRSVLADAGTDPHTATAALALIQLLCCASRSIAKLLEREGILAATHAILTRGFVVAGGVAPSAPPQLGTGAAVAGNLGASAAVFSEAETSTALPAAAAGVWRCFVAYSLGAPALASWFPLFSQATHSFGIQCAADTSLVAAVFSLLETCCFLPARRRAAPADEVSGTLTSSEQSTGLVDAGPWPHSPAAQTAGDGLADDANTSGALGHLEGLQAKSPAHATPRDLAAADAADARSASFALPDPCPTAGGDVPELPRVAPDAASAMGDEGWRQLSAFVPAALTLLRKAESGSGAHDKELLGSAFHFVASYLQALPRQPLHEPLPLMPWCEMIVRHVLLPFQSSAAFTSAVLLVEELAHAGGRCSGGVAAPPAVATAGVSAPADVGAGEPRGLQGEAEQSTASLLAGEATPVGGRAEALGDQSDGALELLLGWARSWWQATRLHRGLLFALGESSGATPSAAQTLWGLAAALPDSIGLDGACIDPAVRSAGSGTSPRRKAAVYRSAGRLGYFAAVLIDAFECCDASGGLAAPTCEAPGAIFVQLVGCSLSWMQPGDEVLARGLMSSLLLNSRWLSRVANDEGTSVTELRAALLPTFLHVLHQPSQAAQLQSQARSEPLPQQISSLRLGLAQAVLPLTADWMTSPTHHFETDSHGSVGAEELTNQVHAALQLILLLQRLAPLLWIAPARLLCRGLHIFTLPATPWRDARVAALLKLLLHSLLGHGGRSNFTPHDPAQQSLVEPIGQVDKAAALLAYERGVDVAQLLERVLDVYSGESYGDELITQWVLLALRTAEPESLRLSTWRTLEELAHKLPIRAPPKWAASAWRAPEGGAGEGDKVLEAFETSLTRGSLRKADRSSFLYKLAVHHVGAAAFGSSPVLLHRLLVAVEPRVCFDLSCESALHDDLDDAGGSIAPQPLPHRLRAVYAAVAECASGAAGEESKLSTLRAVEAFFSSKAAAP